MASLPDQPAARLAIVLLVCAVFLWLRVDNWPRTYFADELIPLAVVQHMEQTGTLDTNWDNADWRGDYAGNFFDLRQYNFSSYHVALRALKAVVSPWQLQLPDIVLYRYFSILFQALALLLVIDIVRRVAGWPAAALAGLFMAVMPQSVIDAHYARPETFVTLLVAAGLWLGWRSCRAVVPGWVDALSAVVWGVAFACKISLLPMVVVAWCWLAWRSLRREAIPLPLLAGWWLVFAAGFAVSAPYAFANPQGFLGGAGLLFTQYTPGVAAAGEPIFTSTGVLVSYLLAFFGWPVWLLVLLSVCTRAQPLRTLAIAGILVTVFYGVFFAYQKVFFERNLSHLLPLWATLVACGAQLCWQRAYAIPHAQARIACQAILLLLLAGMMAMQARMSYGIVGTFFGGSTVIADQVAQFEKTLQATPQLQDKQQLHGAQQQVPIQRMNPMHDFVRIHALPRNAVLQVPRFKLPEQALLDARLQEIGWVPVARLDLPFGFLPYNQLQINHAPVAYDYYRYPGSPQVTP